MRRAKLTRPDPSGLTTANRDRDHEMFTPRSRITAAVIVRTVRCCAQSCARLWVGCGQGCRSLRRPRAPRDALLASELGHAPSQARELIRGGHGRRNYGSQERAANCHAFACFIPKGLVLWCAAIWSNRTFAPTVWLMCGDPPSISAHQIPKRD